MKIFSAEQIYAADKATIKKQEITSDELMERAATQLFNWLHLRLQGEQVKIHLFCGIGNNGGDGLALARQLQEHGYTSTVYVVNYSKKRSDDFLTNLKRLKDGEVWPEFLEEGDDLPEIGGKDIIVDAIFGLGLNRPPDSWVVELFEHLHRSQAFTLSVDIPSGLFTDKAPANEKAVVKANHTLSFQVPKLIFFLPETGIYTEQWELLDIGLDTEFLMNADTDYELIGQHEVLSHYIPREKYSHKGTYGHSLIIGGSYGKIGAVHLAAKACLRSGSGLVTAFIPQCGYIPLQTNFPEAMVITDMDEKYISKIDFDISPNAIGIGMGMGRDKKTLTAFSDFLDSNETPLVVDADALNILSENKELLKKLPSKTVLTPHPKELERLIGKWDDDFEKLERAKAFSKAYDCVLVIKGSNTIVISDGKGYVNTTGNPGMGTGGTGDVLTGIITGLIAQGYEPLQAAIFGVYLHGRAGDIAVEKTGYQALTASNVIDGIGGAFLDLFKTPEENHDIEMNEPG
ncbi:NAD(P)H-hydrate dehydratase [Pricia sp.]|uniref:NAD(P)H-hydrate dehydratase n=1 Tax=Pricia sp. TaxID=2268138 RepID=UPI0035938257